MKKKIIIAYLCSPYIPKKNLNNFIHYYKKYKPGVSHKLIICFKNLTLNQINYFRKKLKKIKHDEFIDKEKKNDFDFGTNKRVATKYKNNLLFFMNGHSYPVIKNWLTFYKSNYRPKRIIASTGSYESISSKSLYRHHSDNYLNFIYKIIKYHFMFPIFPNPHIRTTNFLILGKDFLKYKYLDQANTKEKAWCLESGKNSIYNYFKIKNYKIYLVNSKNELFTEKNWYKSETYAFKKQSKKIMSDNRIRKYDKLQKNKKIKKSITVWGIAG